MKDLQYYPTPEGLAGRMAGIVMEWAKGLKVDGRREIKVLDPSAGTGNLLEALHKANLREYQGSDYTRHEFGYYGVEIDLDRRIVLEQNSREVPNPRYPDEPPMKVERIPKLRVIGHSFEMFRDDRVFDVMLMNPPFNCGADHFIRAWELLESGLLVCLLNAATWESDRSGPMQVRNIVKDYQGAVEILEGEFLVEGAERKTGVRVALIKVVKPEAGNRFDFSSLDVERDDWSFDESNTGVRRRDVVGDMVDCYEAAKANFMEALRAYHRAVKSLGEFAPTVKPEEFFNKGKPRESYEGFVKAMRERGWQLVFQKTGVASVATEKVRKDFEKEMSRQQGLAFTEENIRELLGLVMANRGKVMEDGIVSVFDYLTRYHEENRCHPEGWKTNKAWKVTRKFIVPRLWYDFDNYTYVRYETKRELDDIDRAMGYLRGRKIDEEGFLTIADVLDGAVKGRDMGWVYSTFFKLRWYKKGTLHCEFLDGELYDDFNRAAMVGKRWLPDLRKK